jgi:CBS domain-containing membrane protein
MNSAIERMLSLRVADVMSKSVVSIPHSATMSEAAELMTEQNVRGLPVVDAFGKCVGMLTTTDFARRGGTIDQCGAAEDEFELVEGFLAPVHIERVADDSVARHMTPAVQSIAADSTLLTAARYLCAEHIHRLVVLDPSERPAGLISSLDIVSAFVTAIEE